MTTKPFSALLTFFLACSSSFASDSVLVSGTIANPSNSATNYGCPYGFTSGTWGSVETTRRITCASAGTFSKFRVNLLTAPGSGNSYTFTILKNGSSTGVTVAISGTATTGSDLSNTFTVVAGDMINVEAVPASTPTQPDGFRCSLVFSSDTAGESMLFANSVSTLLTTTTKYLSFGGSIPGGTTTESLAQIVIPTDGTLKNLVVNLQNAPGGIQTRTFTIYKNGSPELLLVTITGVATQGSDLGVTTVDVAPGDVISIRADASASAADSHAYVGLTFLADTAGEFIIAASPTGNLDNGNVEYTLITGGVPGDSPTETLKLSLTDAVTFKAIYVVLSGEPGAGNSYTFNLRDDIADAGLSVAISDAATTGNTTGASVSVAAGSLIATSSTPASTPTTRTGMISYLATVTAAGDRRVILISEKEDYKEAA